MAQLAALALLVCCALAHAENVSPVEKVITLMTDLREEVIDEGAAEASTYDTFACFCKTTTETKAAAIKTEKDNIEGYAAELHDQTAISNAKGHEMKELEELIADLDKQMAKIEAMREAEKTRYEATAADLSKAIASVDGAIAQLHAMSGGASLAQVKNSVRRSLFMADALDISPKQSHALSALLQEENETPAGEYSFHADDLIAVVEDLSKEFTAKKGQLDQIEGQNAQDYTNTMATKNSEKSTAVSAKATATTEKDTADGEIATNTADLTLEEATLKDDELYLKDLTAQCELKAREWDQRSQMRNDEKTALTKALQIIKQGARANAGATRGKAPALLIQQTKAPQDARNDIEEGDVGSLAFVQMTDVKSKLRGLAKVADTTDRRARALSSLIQKAKKMNSPILTALAMKAAADPFLKVKKLIQDLIERLVTEAAAEATKKGWCDTETGKATHNRNSNMDAVKTINTELEELEARKASLEAEIATLTQEISDLNSALAKQTKLRTDEKAENMDTLDKAKAGLAAVNDARDVLDAFYKGAAKGAVSLIQASPVQAPASHSGAYQGNQQKSGGIMAMLDVIISDFERSIKVTTDSEHESNAAFVDYERTTKSSIMSKETGKSQDEVDLAETDQHITEGMDDLDAHQKMLDDSLKELEDLRPACVDTGMSYADRVAKREEEIDALKQALCELDGDNVEPDCPV